MANGWKHGGLGNRYIVKKTNGTTTDPNAVYFVLRLDKDPHARHAVACYAESVREENPEFADDLVGLVTHCDAGRGAVVQYPTDSGATLSLDRVHRFALWRIWDRTKRVCAFIGLNPSTADESHDDHTIRRCVKFAKDWGFGGVVMLNAISFRATDPKVMKAATHGADIHEVNMKEILLHTRDAGKVVAAWGTDGAHLDCGKLVAHFLKAAGVGIQCLGKTQGGYPKHPSRLAADTKLEAF